MGLLVTSDTWDKLSLCSGAYEPTVVATEGATPASTPLPPLRVPDGGGGADAAMKTESVNDWQGFAKNLDADVHAYFWDSVRDTATAI